MSSVEAEAGTAVKPYSLMGSVILEDCIVSVEWNWMYPGGWLRVGRVNLAGYLIIYRYTTTLY